MINNFVLRVGLVRLKRWFVGKGRGNEKRVCIIIVYNIFILWVNRRF